MKHLILSPGKAGTHSLLKYLKNIFPEDTIYRTHWISSETTNFVAKSGFWNNESINEQIALAKKNRK
ncbi:MAG: hypothetical protein EBR01_12905 [Proteobacteria bacterium]|nr:hypothetical protein [Pseudomonadota bacterium]